MTKTGSQTSWQYILEDTAENPTSSGNRFMLPGIVTNSTIEPRFNTKEIRGFKQPSDTDNRRVDDIRSSKNEYAFSVTYVPVKRLSDPKYDFRHFHNTALNNSSSTAAGGGWTYGTSITSNLRSFTIFKEIDNLQHRLSGCKINRLTSRCSVDNPVEITVEGFGSFATFADLSRTDATTLRDGTPFYWSDVQVYIDGALATFCTAYEFNVTNGAESDWVLGDRDPKAVILKGRSIDVSVTRQYNSTEQYVDAKNSTAKSITIRLDDATDADIKFRSCKWDGHPIPGQLEGTLTHILKAFAEEMSTN